jgi:hypothetical protein
MNVPASSWGHVASYDGKKHSTSMSSKMYGGDAIDEVMVVVIFMTIHND